MTGEQSSSSEQRSPAEEQVDAAAPSTGSTSEEHSQSKANDTSRDADKTDKPPTKDGTNDDESQRRAAELIQKNYRGYKTRREIQGMGVDANSRWGEALSGMKLDNARTQQSGKGDDAKNDATSRWKRGGLLMQQIAGSPATGDGDKVKGSDPKGMTDPVEGGPSIHDNKADPQRTESDGIIGDVPGANDREGGKVDNIPSIAKPNQRGLKMIEWWTRGAAAQDLSKTMEATYWLEMVDRKHRYGSNLKPYHAKWSEADTKENFFVWLDEGGGKDLDLEDEGCPRERLEKERIDYLNSEQRRNYIIDVKEGKLYWRRNGKPLDTTKNKYKDLGHGQGIVELGPEEQEERRRLKQEKKQARKDAAAYDSDASSISSASSSSSSSSSSSDSASDSEEEREEKEAARHYGGDKKKRQMLSSKNWMDALLRKTVSQNTWIYVLNSRRELYVGLKQTGKFQHSSFLYGGRVLSAGLLKAKDGVLTSLSPLSGHYRAGTAHFRHFISLLQQEGVDLDHVTLSKSLLMLRGMEVYGKMMKKKGDKKKSAKKGVKGKKGEEEKEGEKSKQDDNEEVRGKGEGGSSTAATGSKTAEKSSSGNPQSQTLVERIRSTKDDDEQKGGSTDDTKASSEQASTQQDQAPPVSSARAANQDSVDHRKAAGPSSSSATTSTDVPAQGSDKPMTLIDRIRGSGHKEDHQQASSGDDDKGHGLSAAFSKLLHPHSSKSSSTKPADNAASGDEKTSSAVATPAA